MRASGEVDLEDPEAAQLCGMSAAAMGRRMAGQRKQLEPKCRAGTKPGSLLKSAIPIRTWAQWDEKAPGFVEIVISLRTAQFEQCRTIQGHRVKSFREFASQ